MSTISLANFVKFTVATPGAALPPFNPNTLALLTKDAPPASYGAGAAATCTIAAGAVNAVTVSAGGGNYGNPPPVSFTGGGGTGAVAVAVLTAGVVTGINIINGGKNYTGAPTVVIGQGWGIYNNAAAVGADFGTSSETYLAANNVFSQVLNPSSGGGVLVIYAMSAGDTISSAVLSLSTQLSIGGYAPVGYTPNNAEYEAGAATVQGLNPPALLGVATSLISDIYPGGLIATIQSATQIQAICMLYTIQAQYANAAQAARLTVVAFLARLMSVNFSGANTFATMNLKQLANVQPDTGISDTILTQCQTVGANVYGTLANILPESVSAGGNGYADAVYGQGWLQGAITIAAFNYMAQTATKIPQTDAGVQGILGAIIQVLEQAVTNGFIAPGSWNGPIPFGDPATFLANIAQYGWYIYAAPIASQTQAQRQTRAAPLIQVACKEAGAIQQIIGIIYPQP